MKWTTPHRDEVGPPADSWARAALDFLERSRDVADERVIDLVRGEISTSRGEDAADAGSGTAV